MNRINRLIAVVFMLLGVVIFLVTPSQVSEATTSSMTLGPAFFPTFVSILIMAGAVGLFWQSQNAIKYGYEMEERPTLVWRREAKAAIVFAMMVVYVLLLRRLGFLLSSSVFGVGLLRLLGARKWWYHAVYLAAVCLVYFVFTRLLYVHLPVLGWWIF